jgi:hypothetical protein
MSFLENLWPGGGDFLGNILDWGSEASSVIPAKDSNQMGDGLFSLDLINSVIKGGTGLAGIWLGQKGQRDQIEQLNAQAEDQYKLEQEKLAQEKEIAEMQAAEMKRRTMMDSYNNWVNAYSGIRRDTMGGFKDLADAMQTPLNYRSAVLK